MTTTTTTVRTATEGQLALIRTLAAERGVEVPSVATFDEAKIAIPALIALPRPSRQTRTYAPLPDVPEGHYATSNRTGTNDLDFWRVDRPTEGKWAGRTFVKRIVGGHPEIAVRGAEARKALEAILEAGVPEAGARYGQEIGRCYVCHRTLTDDVSRARGIGSTCAGRI